MTPIVLASASSTRKSLLEAAGVPVVVETSEVDEAAIKAASSGGDTNQTALALAEHKALAVAGRRSPALVIGADQMLECEGRWFDKPDDQRAARDQLRALRGKTHRLVTAVVLASDRQVRWRHVEAAVLTMRPFSDEFLDAYLARAGDAVLASVGAYQLEGLGAQLFDRITGDHFTILGLPLLPLLAALRAEGALGA